MGMLAKPDTVELQTPRRGLLLRVWTRYRQQTDLEPEQALIRLGLGAFFALYFVANAYVDGKASEIEHHTIIVALLFCMVSLFVMAHIFYQPVTTVWRRIFGMHIDIGTTTYLMAAAGSIATPLFIVYLWVSFGNGFRYGTRYLYLSSGLSMIGFVYVILTSSYWDSHEHFAWGLAASLVVLPAYVSILIRKLHSAVQRANEASQAKSQFLARMSHELRTPLNGVIGMTHLLMQTRLDKDQKEIAETVVTSGRLLSSLIENVLDFSKIEAGKIDIEKIQIDLHALLNGIAAVFQPQAKAKGLQFAVHIAPDVPYAINEDPVHLRHILVNLLGNALKFTDKGYVELDVSLAMQDGDRCVIRFAVEDSGPGISPESQSRIFESFTQADSSTTRRYGGTGLGTTIAKQLVELLGGRITLQSKLGAGSTFIFELPVEVQSRHEASTKPLQLDSCRVLVVSKNRTLIEQITRMLGTWSVPYEVVGHSTQAFAKLLQSTSNGRTFNVILIDSNRADLYPMQFCTAVRADPSLQGMAMVLLREQGDSMNASEYLRAGFASVLISPPETRQLYNVLHAVIAREDDAYSILSRSDQVTPIGQKGMKRLKVLVAEDNPVNQTVVQRILQSSGHEVTIVENGEDALDELESGGFNIVVADMRMPGMNGLEAMKIHRFTEHGQRTPWVMLTGDATQETMDECKAAGVDAYLTKPINPKMLLATVHQLTNEQTRENQAPERRVPVRVSQPAGTKIFDPTILDELADYGEHGQFIEQAVQRFTSDSLANIQRMQQALRENDYDTLRDAAHSLKGSSGSVGASALSELSALICRLPDHELSKRSGDLLHDLVSVYEQTAVHIEGYAKRKSHTGR
jgi:two-component system sensor histidine kinase RpfC